MNITIMLFKNQALTPMILKAGLPLNCIQTYKDPELFKKAQKVGLAENWHGQDPEDVLYATNIKYYWNQTFPAKENTVIEHEYIPLYGGGHQGYLKDAWAKKLFWTDDIFKNGQLNVNYDYYYRKIDFILTTANTWRGHISNFKLVIIPKYGNIIGSSIGPLKLNKAGNYEVNIKDYFPE